MDSANLAASKLAFAGLRPVLQPINALTVKHWTKSKRNSLVVNVRSVDHLDITSPIDPLPAHHAGFSHQAGRGASMDQRSVTNHRYVGRFAPHRQAHCTLASATALASYLDARAMVVSGWFALKILTHQGKSPDRRRLFWSNCEPLEWTGTGTSCIEHAP